MSDELMEMSFGSWEGQTWESIPNEQLHAWADDIWRYRPGGAESAAMVRERWDRWSSGLGASADAAVAVTHAGIIRIALLGAGLTQDATFAEASIGFGSVHRIDLGKCAP